MHRVAAPAPPAFDSLADKDVQRHHQARLASLQKLVARYSRFREAMMRGRLDIVDEILEEQREEELRG